ncbi:hypothetical protein MMC13_006338 [Lambiella insularis]|nr:hypothetical protein [Lambiella insularis]
MARNLRAKISDNDTLVVCDNNSRTSSQFLKDMTSSTGGKDLKLEVAQDPREVAEKSSTLLTALPEPSHVKGVFESILSSPLPTLEGSSYDSRLFIDASTIDPTTSRSIASSVHSSGAGHFVDAPMSGGAVGASKATLTFMLGCDSDEAFERARATLSLIGARVLQMGPQGAGLAAKLANNYILAISNIAVCEAMNLGLKNGLDPKKLGELINSSSGRCWASEVNNPVEGVSEGSPAGRGYEGGFGVGLMRKDLRLALEAAKGMEEGELKLILGDLAQRVYETVEQAESGKDFSVVYKWLSEGNRLS